MSNEIGIPAQIVNWKGILDTAVNFVNILFQYLPGKTDINHIKPVPTVASNCLLKMKMADSSGCMYVPNSIVSHHTRQ